MPDTILYFILHVHIYTFLAVEQDGFAFAGIAHDSLSLLHHTSMLI